MDDTTPTTSGPGGPVRGLACEDLNATIVEWPGGGGPPEHVNAERDIVLVVVSGSVVLELDGERSAVAAGEIAVIPKGSLRRIVAGPEGVRYVTVHRRREGLEIAPLPATPGG
jgi:quercetin dioxygenase-like cupin family protein